IEQRHDLLIWSITGGLREGTMAASAAVSGTEHPAAAMYHLLHQRQPRRTIVAFLDLVAHLKEERTLRLLRETIDKLAQADSHVSLVDHCDALPDVIKHRATAFDISYPDEKELEALIKSTLRTFNEQRRLSVNMSRRGLDTIIRNLRGLTRSQARQVILDTI